jgi:hemerythrin-like metal-binding protein
MRTQGSDGIADTAGGRRPETAQLIWRADYATGHELIDRQHRRLFSIGNELIASLLAGSSAADIELLLDDLVGDIGEHFTTEEAVLAEAGRPLDADHLDHHRALRERIKDYRDNCHGGRLRINELVKFIANDVIAGHIIMEDLRLGTHDKLRFMPPDVQPGIVPTAA